MRRYTCDCKYLRLPDAGHRIVITKEEEEFEGSRKHLRTTVIPGQQPWMAASSGVRHVVRLELYDCISTVYAPCPGINMLLLLSPEALDVINDQTI